MNIDEIRELAKIVTEYHLESIEVESRDMKSKIKITAPVHSGGEVQTAAPAAFTAPSPASPAPQTGRPGAKEIPSPMVGVFYAAPSPDAEPFVRVGDHVKRGDVLCIIEAMKLMNEIPAEQDGEISDVCVENGQVVEFGQALFKII